MNVTASVLDSFSGAFDFIFNQREPVGVVGEPVGGLHQVLEFAWTQIWISALALVVAVVIALMILGLPPILTNAFVGIRQVDRGAVEAARGMGMTEPEVILRVELPLAVPTIMSGVRTAAINIIATATIAPLAGVLTLGEFIIDRNVFGPDGLLAGAILVALLALAAELLLAGLQRLLTPRGLAVERRAARTTA